MNKMISVVGFVAVAASMFACSATVENEDPKPSPECTTNDDCGNGTCSGGKCVAPKTTLNGDLDEPAQPPAPVCKADDWSFKLPTCDTCAEGKCCTQLAACGKDCEGYRDCIAECTTTACLSTCRTTWSAGTKAFDAVTSCLSTSCKTECIPKKGIGDACTKGSECESGECTGGGWCTKSCTRGSDCDNPSSVTNEFGSFNYCVETSGGSRKCFPGCSSATECHEQYDTGLGCRATATTPAVCTY